MHGPTCSCFLDEVGRMTTVSTGPRFGVGMMFVSIDCNAVLISSVSVGSCITCQSTEDVAETVPSKTWCGTLGELRTQTILSLSSVVNNVQFQYDSSGGVRLVILPVLVSMSKIAFREPHVEETTIFGASQSG